MNFKNKLTVKFLLKPDYDDIENEKMIKLARGKSDKGKDNKKYGKLLKALKITHLSIFSLINPQS